MKIKQQYKGLAVAQHNNTRDSFTGQHMINCQINGANKFGGRKNIQKAEFKLSKKR